MNSELRCIYPDCKAFRESSDNPYCLSHSRYCRLKECHHFIKKVNKDFCDDHSHYENVRKVAPISPRNPHFTALLKEMAEIHDRKSHDYAKDDNVYSNFEYAEMVARPFTGVDKVFATLIGIKFARLAELLSGKEPKNERIDDTFLDQTTYSGIWAAYRRSLREK